MTVQKALETNVTDFLCTKFWFYYLPYEEWAFGAKCDWQDSFFVH